MKLLLKLILILLCFNILAAKYKNVHILDFKSEKDMKRYMKSISKDLGVKCTFCHDINDKSLDDNHHKIIAREMIKMQNNLNEQFFFQMSDSASKKEAILQISCWTCHRGFATPDLVRPK